MCDYTCTEEFDSTDEAYVKEHEERYLYLSIFDNFELNDYVYDDIVRIRELKDPLEKNIEIEKLKLKIFDYTNTPKDHEFLIDDYIHNNVD